MCPIVKPHVDKLIFPKGCYRESTQGKTVFSVNWLVYVFVVLSITITVSNFDCPHGLIRVASEYAQCYVHQLCTLIAHIVFGFLYRKATISSYIFQ